MPAPRVSESSDPSTDVGELAAAARVARDALAPRTPPSMRRPAGTDRGAWREQPDIGYAGRWFLFAVLIGVAAGLAAAAFFELLELCEEFFTHRLAGFQPPAPGGDPQPENGSSRGNGIWYGLLLVPAVGGLIAGVFNHFFARGARSGTDAVLEAFHRHRGRLSFRQPFARALSSAVVIGSGGSVGREGPMVSLGAALGSFVGRVFKLPARERRTALLVGAAAGFASIFRAPLSGAIFAVESPYKNPEFEYRAFVPAIIGAVAAYATFGALYEFRPVFDVGALRLEDPRELLLYALFGLVCAAAGVVYVTILRGTREYLADPLFDRCKVPVALRPAVGGLLLGALVLLVPEVWGTGYGWVQQAIDGTLAGPGARGVLFLFALALAKVVATSITHGSRGGEGVFGPAFFVGAMVGAAYGQLAARMFPEVVTQPAAYVLLGMSGVFAGVTKVPIAGLVMVCEITGSYGLLLPLVLVCSLSYVFTGGVTLYRSQVTARFESPANFGEFSPDVLGPLRVKDAFRSSVPARTVARSAPIAAVLALVPETRQTTFPVVDEQGALAGAVTLEDLREFLFDKEVHQLVLVAELLRPFPSVSLDEPLVSALGKLAGEGCEEIPVVGEPGPDGSAPLLGLLSREEIITLYRERTERQARAVAEQAAAD